MSVLAFAAGHYAVLIVFALLCYGVGRTVLRRLSFENVCEEIAFSTSMGLGLFGMAVFLAGTLRLLYPFTIFLLFLTAAALSIGTWRTVFERLRRLPWRSTRIRWRAVATLLVIIIVVPLALGALYPPHTWDAIMYHLPGAKLYAQEHQIRPTPYLRYCVIPQLQEMLFTLMLLIADDAAAQSVQLLAALLTALAIGGWAARKFGVAAGVWAGAFWLGDPQTVHLGTIAYVEIGVALYVALTVLAFANWRESRNQTWLVTSGAMAGFAAGSKYTALFVILCIFVYLIWDMARRRDWKPVVLFAAVALAAGGTWYVRNLYYTGSPTSPYLDAFFGSGCWSEADAEMISRDREHYGLGRDLRSFIRFPYDIVTRHTEFAEVDVSPLLFFPLPLSIWFGLRKRAARPLLVIVLLFIVFWFWTAQAIRFLVPIFPILAILTAGAAAEIATLLRLLRYPVVAVVLVTVVALAALVPGYRWLRDINRSRGKIPTSQRERDLFYQRFPAYRCHMWLNREHGRDYRVYVLYSEYMFYFLDGTRIGDILGPGRYSDMKLGSARDLLQSLNRHYADYFMDTSEHHLEPLYRDPFFQEHFELVCSCSNTRLWRIHQGPRASMRTQPLAGGVAGVVDDANTLTQTINGVGPWTLYQVSVEHRTTSGARKLRIALQWLDQAGELVGSDQDLYPTTVEGRRADFPVTSPEDAAAAIVTFSGQQGQIYIDDVSVRRID